MLGADPTNSPGENEAPLGAFSDKGALVTKAAGSILWDAGAQFLQLALGFINAAVLAIWLRPADYGTFGMAITVVGFVAVFGDIGLTSALIRHPKVGPTEETTAFILGLLGGCLLLGVSLLSAPLIGFYFRNPSAGAMAAVLSLQFLPMALSRVSVAKLNRSMRFRELSLLAILGSLSSTAAGVVAAALGAGSWSLAIAFLAAPSVLAIAYVRLERPRLVRRGYSREVARTIAGFGANLSGFTIAVSIAGLPATILLGRFADAAAVGLFSLGMRLVVIPIQRISSAFGAVFLPSLLHIDPGDRPRAYFVALRTLTMSTAPLAIGLFVVAEELVTLLPREWHGLAPVLRYFSIGMLIQPMGALPLSRLIAEGRAHVVLRLGLLAIPISWIGYSIAAHFGGVLAFVAAWSAIYIVIASIHLIVVAGDATNLLKAAQALAPPLFAAIGMGIIVHFVQAATHTAGTKMGLAIGVGAGIISYAALVRVTMPRDIARARGAIASLLRRRPT
jgi:O-antigen/teichoic acid export membrane protein